MEDKETSGALGKLLAYPEPAKILSNTNKTILPLFEATHLLSFLQTRFQNRGKYFCRDKWFVGCDRDAWH